MKIEGCLVFLISPHGDRRFTFYIIPAILSDELASFSMAIATISHPYIFLRQKKPYLRHASTCFSLLKKNKVREIQILQEGREFGSFQAARWYVGVTFYLLKMAAVWTGRGGVAGVSGELEEYCL